MHMNKKNFPITLHLLYCSGDYPGISEISHFMSEITAHRGKNFI